ncbi:MAG: copper amine oxidase N-terminal domain-containing protein [Peptococcaceae bacterium]|nr:copper amine oxidase N-terminal domain-containing protein [Peptococcaceae bacterium]
MKKWRVLLIAAVLAVGLSAVPAHAYGTFEGYSDLVTAHVDGKYVPTDVPANIDYLTNRTYLPMRAVAEALGANVSWNQQKRCATVEKNGRYYYFFIDSYKYYTDDGSYYMDAAPKIMQGRTMLPVRGFSEALGARVEWDGYLGRVDIYTGGPVAGKPSISEAIPYELRWIAEKYYVPYSSNGSGSWFSVNGQSEVHLVFISQMRNGVKNVIQVDKTGTRTQVLLQNITQQGTTLYCTPSIWNGNFWGLLYSNEYTGRMFSATQYTQQDQMLYLTNYVEHYGDGPDAYDVPYSTYVPYFLMQ